MPTSVVQSALEYSATAPASVPPTLHFTFLSVASSGLTVAVSVSVSPTVIVAEVLSSSTPVTLTTDGVSSFTVTTNTIDVTRTVTTPLSVTSFDSPVHVSELPLSVQPVERSCNVCFSSYFISMLLNLPLLIEKLAT